jgi:hypothetical protein
MRVGDYTDRLDKELSGLVVCDIVSKGLLLFKGGINGVRGFSIEFSQLVSDRWKYVVRICCAGVTATNEELGAEDILVVECTGNGRTNA